MARCSDADEILRLVLARSAEAIGCDNAHIALREGDGWELRYGYREGGTPALLRSRSSGLSLGGTHAPGAGGQ